MNLDGLTVLIDGGTGSFGQRFTEVAPTRFKPQKLAINSRDELKQHEMRLRFSEDRHA